MAQRAYVHLGSDTPLSGLPIHAFLREVAGRHGQRDAIVSVHQGRRLSYAAFQDAVDDLARGLIALGLERGDRVGIWSTDNVEWALVQVATARVGAVLVNINPAYSEHELEQALQSARPKALVLQTAFRASDYVGVLRGLCPEIEHAEPGALDASAAPDLRHVIVFDAERGDDVARPAPGFWTWPQVLAAGREVTPAALESRGAQLDADDPINIQFTSGTTGTPKPVVLTHHNILNNGYFIGRLLGFCEHDRLCVPVPFYHCFGMVVANLACLTHGAAIVIPAPHFDAEATLSAIAAERCTAVHGVPTMFVDMLERLDAGAYDLSSLRTGVMAGAPCPPELMKRVMTEMGCADMRIGYGQTEASPVTHLTREHDSFERRVETVGTNLPHQETKIVDPATGALLSFGEQGEVCFRGYHVMHGYFERPEATREAVDERGWLHSGDLGVLDQTGYLRITGRLKDMIIRGGENIYPAEIEAWLFTHPQVAQVAVVGVPDERLGEEVAAWIQLHEGEHATPESLQAYAREGLAHFKVPRTIRLVDSFPMTITGKIQKFRIREQMAAEHAAE